MRSLRSRTWRALVVAAAVAAASAGGSGCGYALAGRGSFLPSYITTIGIPEFANRTTVFNLETQVTQKVRAEFVSRGRYKVVPDQEGVDALLTGAVSDVRIEAVSFTQQGLASRYQIIMSARVELRDMKENKVLWENPALVFRDDYQAQSGATALDPTAFFAQDVTALDRLTSEFARTIVSAILEAF